MQISAEVIFAILAISIFTVGCRLLMLIRKHYPLLHKQYGCIFWLALFCLSVPLSIRTILDIAVPNYLDDGTAAAFNVAFFLFADYLPIIFQTSSLIFGFVRNK